MKSMHRIVRIHSFLLAAVLLAATPSQLQAQGAAKATIDKPDFDDLPSPDNSPGKSKSFKPKDWLEVEAKVKIDVRPEPKVPFIDRVTVKWYVAVENPESRGFLLLTKDVNHVNVPTDEDVYVSCYLSPSTIKRLTGKDRAGKSSVDRVGIEILWNGVKVGEASTKGDEGWWNSPSLSRTDKYPLLNKNETPFKIFWWDRYAEIEETR
jgi:hypothetical protein